MARVFVVDANVINAFQTERLCGDPGAVNEALAALLKVGHIAMDEGNLCKQEWVDCAAGTYPLAITDWFNDRLVDQSIQLYPLAKSPPRKALLQIGLPRKDHKWVLLAASASALAIISEDIDFLDCTKKTAHPTVKLKIRRTCKGPTQKWILKQTGADVWLTEVALRKCAALQP